MKSLLCIQDELSTALSLLEQARLAELTDAFADRTRRWFVSGQGRSRLVGCMAAMRLMHVGFDVYVKTETASSVALEGKLMRPRGASAAPASSGCTIRWWATSS